MTNRLAITATIVITIFVSLFTNAQQFNYLEVIDGDTFINKNKYVEFFNNHPYSTRKHLDKKTLKSIPKHDRPDLAYELEWLLTHDPKTGNIEWNRLIPEIKKINASKNTLHPIAPGSAITNQWVERGPNNFGGRTRAIMFDPKDVTNKKVWAGGSGGGLWYNNDITSSASSWVALNDFWANLAVTSLTYDPTADSVFYCGTGGSYGTNTRGGGIWQSTNAGQTWSPLSSTSGFSFRNVLKVLVTSTGRLLVGTNNGLYSSDNDGATFTQRNFNGIGDIEEAANGDLYATSGKIYVTGKIFKSTNNGTTWTDITPTGGSPERIEIACAPSDSNTIYAVAAKQPPGNQDVAWFKKSLNGGVTWTNITIPTYLSNVNSHFTRGQAWFDLILWVHPTDADVVMAGGIDLHRTINGGTNWSSVSYWTPFLSVPFVHADQHNIISRPGHNNEIIVSNDGGVYYSSNAGNKLDSAPSFTHMVKDYNVTQFYSSAMHPTAGSNYMLAGSQDNGTISINGPNVSAGVEATGGDGGFCFIDQTSSATQITSYVRNNWFRSRNNGASFSTLQSASDGLFINPADYDDNLNILYSSKSTSQLNRISDMTSATVTTGSINVSTMSSISSHIRVSPYTTTSSTLFVGSGGDVFKVLNANGATPSTTKITPTTFPSGSISCVEIGASENELLVTFSNYGVNSVWYTSNGGTTWTSKEGNLADMPVRWALFNPTNRLEVILATELGIYSTPDISASSVVWSLSSLGSANTRIDMLQYRSSDSLIMASTHGRGIFTGRFTTPPTSKPIPDFSSNKTTICAGESITFTDLSTNSPTALLWTFTGGTPSTSTATNPIITYSTPGNYAVKLKATNLTGSDSITKTAFITVNATSTATLGSFTAICSNSLDDTLRGGLPVGGTYYINGIADSIIKPATLAAGNHIIKYEVGLGACLDTASQNLLINPAPNVTTSNINLCENSPTLNLTNGSPTGGTYSGNNVSSGMFNPQTANAGNYLAKYVLIDANMCRDSSTFNITVNTKPTISLSAIGPYCSGSSAISLTNGFPVGGLYSGTGVSANSFDPSIAGVGTHNIKYSFTDINNCTDSASTSVIVNLGSATTLSPFSSSCLNDLPITLSGGMPTGGTYSGVGVSSGVFTPLVAGIGTHSITYTSSSSCGNSSVTQPITVNPTPIITVTKNINECIGQSFLFNAQGANNYSWQPTTGLNNASIGNPSLAITANATYFLTSSNNLGCSIVDTINVTANALPTIVASDDIETCEGDTFQLMASGALAYNWLPTTGLKNTVTANPKGALTVSVTYLVVGTDNNNCIGADTVKVNIKPKSQVSIAPISAICSKSNAITLNGGLPTGGSYSGIGVSAGRFFPTIAGVGNHSITYMSSEPGKCTDSATTTITVLKSPNIFWTLPEALCENTDEFNMNGIPTGGVYVGAGVSGIRFNPIVAGIGTHNITYSVTLAGCTEVENRVIIIDPLDTIAGVTGSTTVASNNRYNYFVKPLNGAGYTWIITGGNLVSTTNNISTIRWGTGKTGSVLLIQENSYGCLDSIELSIDINPLSTDESIKIIEGITLFPNPADKSVSLKINQEIDEEITIQLFNSSGQQVLDKNSIIKVDDVYKIDTEIFPTGVYLFHTKIGNKSNSTTLLIQH